MMFSTRAEYGVRVMVALARQDAVDGADAAPVPASLAQIAEQNELPFAYLEHLAARLKKAGLVESRRGPRGGYLLAKPPAEISMAEIVEALEGQIAPIECISASAEGDVTCSREGESNDICPTKILWTRVQGSIVRTLSEMTLADLAGASDRLSQQSSRRRASRSAAPIETVSDEAAAAAASAA
jgi:Rrf2 family protein